MSPPEAQSAPVAVRPLFDDAEPVRGKDALHLVEPLRDDAGRHDLPAPVQMLSDGGREAGKVGNPMDAQRIVQNCVLKNQSTVIEEMIRANLISEEYLYPFADDVMEWWLIDSWLAERLKAQGEVIIEEYGCYWWGRQSSGQAIYMDGVIQEICGND